ncbi:MAG: hypothetical protein RI895_1401 [Actinomycetota bacterium]|jgi:hypothetical protein
MTGGSEITATRNLNAAAHVSSTTHRGFDFPVALWTS